MPNRTFSGPSEDDVVAKIKQAFGNDALILQTRKVKRDGLLGLLGRTMIEIDACDARDARRARRIAQELAARPTPPAAPAPSRAPSTESQIIQRELSAMRQMLSGLADRIDGGAANLGTELQDVYRMLLENQVAKEIATAIVRSLNEKLSRSETRDPEAIRRHLRKALEERIPASGLAAVPGDRPRRLMFVGPTGVGKTTTIAKIAAQMRLSGNPSVGIITTDVYRMAAVEQLRRYADIFEYPLRVVDTSAELARAVKSFADRDLTLIDTAGRSQNDELKINELRSYVEAAQAHEVHLVMSLNSDARALCRVIEKFIPMGVTQIVLTKLDEVETFGLILNVMALVDRKLSYVTFGQEAHTDIEAGSPARLARLILGEEPRPGGAPIPARGTA